jgi:hypothetical protein
MSRNDFVEVDVLRDPDGLGLVAPITARVKPNGFTAFSFAIFKEFERAPGHPTQRTSYMNERHISAMHKLLDRVEKRIAEEQDKIHTARRLRSAKGACR